LIQVKCRTRKWSHALQNFQEHEIMSVYEWARQELRRSQDAAQEIGFDPGLTLRAMLSAVVQQSKGVRSFEDLADELQYLAENLDDQQDYGFMRP
jgi:hypothetical protein